MYLPNKFNATPLERLQGNLLALGEIVNEAKDPAATSPADWLRAAHLIEAIQSCLDVHNEPTPAKA